MKRTNPWLRWLETVALLAVLLLILVGALYIHATVAREAVEAVALLAILGVVRWSRPRAGSRAASADVTRQINAIVDHAWHNDDVRVSGGK